MISVSELTPDYGQPACSNLAGDAGHRRPNLLSRGLSRVNNLNYLQTLCSSPQSHIAAGRKKFDR
jgi:hypothetical protein